MTLQAALPILNPVPADPETLWGRVNGLPGTQPLGQAPWLWVLPSYAAQMAERERLIREIPGQVIAGLPGSEAAAAELLDMVLEAVERHPGYHARPGMMECPDGRVVPLDRDRPLATAGRLVQEDLCLMLRPEGAEEHLLGAAVLCFPANWTLSQKLGRGMGRIHAPVDYYDEGVAKRVQRLLDGVQPDRPIWRSNMHLAQDPALFQPQREDEKWPRRTGGDYVRSERQVLLRLPRSRAVVFAIHTLMLRLSDMPDPWRSSLMDHAHP
ncbi:heme-dependent oxidative N-demethylase family protein [Mangrovicoccus algicola]|uniref:DUF3445 domain-containing protein n=1 Tax=Mangrovicoccus algicola TaxID=2771008 RepID=A0A8J6Z803_9RHOB|nr:DUF3445 domain-containing protein [Mangrovicoccus algicola]MBE3637496.1 DUF3445 domain-containing protein [Mangrovicoccus algicola]